MILLPSGATLSDNDLHRARWFWAGIKKEKYTLDALWAKFDHEQKRIMDLYVHEYLVLHPEEL